jgi:hypothetical protein
MHSWRQRLFQAFRPAREVARRRSSDGWYLFRREMVRRRLQVAVAGLPLMTLYLIPMEASAATPSCPDIKFFGVHGTNEDGPGLPDDEFLGLGETVWNVWQSFSERAAIADSRAVEAVDFPRTTADLPGSLRSLPVFIHQLSQVEPGADQAAAALREQISDTYISCGAQTRYLLVGYSQGAWAIDKALRANLAPGPLSQSAESQVAGILLLGDPAWPPNEPYADKKGVAVSLLSRGVSGPYAPDRFADRFVSYCVSYDGDVYDPICWYDGDFDHLKRDLSAHYTYKDFPDRFVDQLVDFVRREST